MSKHVAVAIVHTRLFFILVYFSTTNMYNMTGSKQSFLKLGSDTKEVLLMINYQKHQEIKISSKERFSTKSGRQSEI